MKEEDFTSGKKGQGSRGNTVRAGSSAAYGILPKPPRRIPFHAVEKNGKGEGGRTKAAIFPFCIYPFIEKAGGIRSKSIRCAVPASSPRTPTPSPMPCNKGCKEIYPRTGSGTPDHACLAGYGADGSVFLLDHRPDAGCPEPKL